MFAVQIDASLPKLKKQGRMSLKPKGKRKKGLFAGELWLEAASAAPLRLWGDLIKSPSFFIRSFRFVQDYRCSSPIRLLVTAQTRLVGNAELAEWLHPVDVPPAIAESGACDTDGAASQACNRPLQNEAHGNESLAGQAR